MLICKDCGADHAHHADEGWRSCIATLKAQRDEARAKLADKRILHCAHCTHADEEAALFVCIPCYSGVVAQRDAFSQEVVRLLDERNTAIAKFSRLERVREAADNLMLMSCRLHTCNSSDMVKARVALKLALDEARS